MAQLVRGSLKEFDEADGDHREKGNVILRSPHELKRARIFSSLEFVASQASASAA